MAGGAGSGDAGLGPAAVVARPALPTQFLEHSSPVTAWRCPFVPLGPTSALTLD